MRVGGAGTGWNRRREAPYQSLPSAAWIPAREDCGRRVALLYGGLSSPAGTVLGWAMRARGKAAATDLRGVGTESASGWDGTLGMLNDKGPKPEGDALAHLRAASVPKHDALVEVWRRS